VTDPHQQVRAVVLAGDEGIAVAGDVLEQVEVVVQLFHVEDRLVRGDRIEGIRLATHDLPFLRGPVVEGGPRHRSGAVPPLARLRCLRAMPAELAAFGPVVELVHEAVLEAVDRLRHRLGRHVGADQVAVDVDEDRKSTRLNSSHEKISYAVFCLKKKKTYTHDKTQINA